MAFLVVLSEEERKYFSFDEKCLYTDGVKADTILQGLPFFVYKYLVNCYPNFVSCDQIFEDVWVIELGKGKPVNDSSVRDKITAIRKYLGDCVEPYKYVETSDGQYRSTKGRKDVDPDTLFSEKKESDADPGTETKGGIFPPKFQKKSAEEDEVRLLVYLTERILYRGKKKEIDMQMELLIGEIIEGLSMGFYDISAEVWKKMDRDSKIEKIYDTYEMEEKLLEKCLTNQNSNM